MAYQVIWKGVEYVYKFSEMSIVGNWPMADFYFELCSYYCCIIIARCIYCNALFAINLKWYNHWQRLQNTPIGTSEYSQTSNPYLDLQYQGTSLYWTSIILNTVIKQLKYSNKTYTFSEANTNHSNRTVYGLNAWMKFIKYAEL